MISHCGSFAFANQSELAPDALLDDACDVRILLEELLRVFAPLTEPLTAVGEPGAALLDDALVDGEIEQIAGARDPFAVHDVEFRFPERWGDFVLHDLDARPAADDHVAVLDARDTPDVDADRRVELERAAARRRLGIAEHDADFLAQLIDEDEAGLRLRHGARELAQRLRHEPRLQPDLGVAHVAFDFGARDQRRHRVDHDDVDDVRANEPFDYPERLLAVVGL